MRFRKILGLNGAWLPDSGKELAFFFPKPTPARKHESETRWISKTTLIIKELGLVVDIWWWYMAAVVVVYGYGSVVVYGHGLVVVYGYRSVADKRWW